MGPCSPNFLAEDAQVQGRSELCWELHAKSVLQHLLQPRTEHVRSSSEAALPASSVRLWEVEEAQIRSALTDIVTAAVLSAPIALILAVHVRALGSHRSGLLMGCPGDHSQYCVPLPCSVQTPVWSLCMVCVLGRGRLYACLHV